MSGILHTYEKQDELTARLSEKIAARLTDGIEIKGAASLAVSGGSTPVPLFERLCQIPLPWEKVRITLVDERWLPPTDTDSNARLVKTHLLQSQAKTAQWLPLKTEHASADEGMAQIDKALQPLLPFDAVVLGMGKDGHTASFFPDAADLRQSLSPPKGQLCAAIESPSSQYPRITLTLPAILHSQQIFVHITGADKKATLDRARQAGAIDELPIRAVLHQNTVPVDIYYCPK